MHSLVSFKIVCFTFKMASVTFLKNQHYSESGKRSQLQYLYDHNKNKPD